MSFLPPRSRTRRSFTTLLDRCLARRDFLKTLTASGLLVLLPQQRGAAAVAGSLTFKPVAPVSSSSVRRRHELRVPEGYTAEVLLAWGDHLTDINATFDPARLTADEQKKRFGYNCDFVGFVPLKPGASDEGLLVVNHEYTNPELMFAKYKPAEVKLAEVEVELAAHGLSVV